LTNLLLILVIRVTFSAMSMLGAQSDNGTPTQNQTSTATDRAKPQPHQPYFHMNAEQRRLFIAKVRQIQLGDTRQSVETLLGKPDVDNLIGPKEKPKPTGRRVLYYVTQYSKDLVNERLDERVSFRFDLNDRLRRIDSNILGVPNQP
jgi:hypothetical protein